MRTTLDIDKDLLQAVTKITGEKSKSKAVHRVLEDFVRQAKIRRLLELPGKVRIIDNLKQLEELELKETKW